MGFRRFVPFILGLLFSLTIAPVTYAQYARDMTPTPIPNPYPPPPYTLDQDTIDNIRAIFALGQRYGNRPDVFSKIGDSITVSPYFLTPIGLGNYDLGGFTYLQPVIDYYSVTPARFSNSFVNQTLSAGVGWAAYWALSPRYADPDVCAPNEPPLMCEYRIVQPSVALIMYGTNDVGYRSQDDFRNDLSQIVQISAGMGVIPILSTIPNRPDMPYEVAMFNHIITEVADLFDVPLWDFYSISVPLPDFGLAWDQVHPSHPPNDIVSTANFQPEHLRYGYTLRNVSALEMLYTVWWHLGLGLPR